MFAITAVTGKVGGTTARTLLKAGHRVRAVVRDRAKGAEWEELGAEVAVATFDDADALARRSRAAEASSSWLRRISRPRRVSRGPAGTPRLKRPPSSARSRVRS
ncbi:NAD(P)H-binding protein [Rhizobium calliandrae]|uniref:NAD(P)H-binding protein n=1 Tax=Rhizobium calliandrae TaxID=1312182 RepID=UPI003D80A877